MAQRRFAYSTWRTTGGMRERAADMGCLGYCMSCQGRRIHHEIASRGRDRDVAAQEDDVYGRMADPMVTRYSV